MEDLCLPHKSSNDFIGETDKQCFPEVQSHPLDELTPETLQIALEILKHEERHSLAHGNNLFKLEMQHIEAILVVQQHESGLADIDPHQLASALLLM